MPKVQEKVLHFAVRSTVKEFLSKSGFRSGESVIDALNEKITAILDAAGSRSKANGRSTIMPYDL